MNATNVLAVAAVSCSSCSDTAEQQLYQVYTNLWIDHGRSHKICFNLFSTPVTRGKPCPSMSNLISWFDGVKPCKIPNFHSWEQRRWPAGWVTYIWNLPAKKIVSFLFGNRSRVMTLGLPFRVTQMISTNSRLRTLIQNNTVPFRNSKNQSYS